MKKISLVLYLILLSFSLLGCNADEKNNTGSNGNKSIVEKQAGDFELKLISKKESYSPHEKTNIIVQIKYIGSKDEVLIKHGGFTPVSYKVIENNRGITITPVAPSILNQMTFKKNQWYTFEFDMSGEVKKDKFHQEYFNKEGFPKGHYTIQASFSFMSKEKGKYDVTGNYATILIGSIDIKVD
jgi:hypothetical protein